MKNDNEMFLIGAEGSSDPSENVSEGSETDVEETTLSNQEDWETLVSIVEEQNALLAVQNDVLQHQYAGQLLSFGIFASLLVIVVLYKFLKIF